QMQFPSQGKWQSPQIDKSRAGTYFLPLPTEDDFKKEKISWEKAEEIQDTTWSAAAQNRVCRLRNMLYLFSEFSYFSEAIIDSIQQLDPRGTTQCTRGFPLIRKGILNPPRRDSTGRWTVPAPEPIPNPPVRPMLERDRSDLLFDWPTIAPARTVKIAAEN